MPPSRPRPSLGGDVRSESASVHAPKSSGNAGNTTTTKGKRSTNHNTHAAQTGKAHSSLNELSSAAAAKSSQAAYGSDTHRLAWSSLDLSVLHTYRHAHELPIPSAYTNPHAHHILSSGIGSRSPSSISSKRLSRNSNLNSSGAVRRSSRSHPNSNNPTSSIFAGSSDFGSNRQSNSSAVTTQHSKFVDMVRRDSLGPRISKGQLVNLVRHHFQGSSVSDSDVRARFRYKVRMSRFAETAHPPREGTGLGGVPVGTERAFRRRFHPAEKVKIEQRSTAAGSAGATATAGGNGDG